MEREVEQLKAIPKQEDETRQQVAGTQMNKGTIDKKKKQ
jgi:hypothetical protein